MEVKISILHFQPLEGYPPILNLLSFLASKPELKVICLSTQGNFGYDYANEAIVIKRLCKVGQGLHSIHRAMTYALFNLSSLFWLITNKPNTILYFETISGWPGSLYKKYLNPRVRLLIHYHEYTTPKEYSDGMAVVRYIHQLERTVYCHAEWISHTIHYRLEKFRSDEKLESLPDRLFREMPNYPPRSWKGIDRHETPNEIIRFVYVGYSLSFDTMYTKEILDWIKACSDKIEFDIYLHKIPVAVRKYIAEHQINNVSLLPSVKYDALPNLLSKYDVGLILYNGAIENFVYNAPNKLFEYLACGLDVWVPSVMTGALDYVCEDAKPRVLALDFTKLDSYPADYLFGKADLPVRQTDYFCEPVYENLYKHMTREG